jgi:hypothetical protein
MPEKGLTSLNQHLDLAWLREAFSSTTPAVNFRFRGQ